MAKPYLQVIAHYFAHAGRGDDVCQLLGQLATETRNEPKNLYYDFFRSPIHPDHFVILEQYSDADGLADHRSMPHFQKIAVGGIIPLLVRREVTSHLVTVE